MALRIDPESGEMGDLIDQYTEPHPLRPAPALQRVRERGVPIWALIGAIILDDTTPIAQSIGDTAKLRALLTDERILARVATEYQLSRESIAAAIAYYWRHKSDIDARLLLNAA